MIGKQHIAYLLCVISLSSVAQGRLWNRGTIQLDAGTEARVHGNIILDAPVTGNGYLVYAGNNTAWAAGQDLRTDYFRMESSAPLQLKNDLIVEQQADFISGVLDASGHEVIFQSYHPTTGGSAASYIHTSSTGYVRFPVNAQTASIPLGINNHYVNAAFVQTGAADTFTVQLWPALTDDGLVTGNAINHHVGLWALNVQEAVAGQNDVTLTLQWPDASLAASFFEPQSALIIFDGTNYIPLSLCGTDLSSINPNTLQTTGLQDVGVFGAGDSLYLPPQPQAIITPVGSTAFCQGDSLLLQSSIADNYLWSNGSTSSEIYVFSEGMYQVTVTDSNGCQSVSVPLDITVYLPNQVTIQETACDAFTWNVDGNTYTEGGSYTVILQNIHGCDSLLTLQLTIHLSTTYNQDTIICPGDSLIVGNSVYYTHGTFIDTLIAQNGCDSIVVTTLDFFISCYEGIQESNAFNVQIYPNPATEWISVVSSEMSGNFPLEIWTVHGQLIQQVTIQLQPSVPGWLDVRQLASGAYLLRVGTKVLPFIKQ